jgi:hypothetical protein
VGKGEHLSKGSNPRFVVTTLSADDHDARALYEDLYCARGEMENRIKECQLDLFCRARLLTRQSSPAPMSEYRWRREKPPRRNPRHRQQRKIEQTPRRQNRRRRRHADAASNEKIKPRNHVYSIV